MNGLVRVRGPLSTAGLSLLGVGWCGTWGSWGGVGGGTLLSFEGSAACAVASECLFRLTRCCGGDGVGGLVVCELDSGREHL